MSDAASWTAVGISVVAAGAALWQAKLARDAAAGAREAAAQANELAERMLVVAQSDERIRRETARVLNDALQAWDRALNSAVLVASEEVTTAAAFVERHSRRATSEERRKWRKVEETMDKGVLVRAAGTPLPAVVAELLEQPTVVSAKIEWDSYRVRFHYERTSFFVTRP